MPDEPSPTTMPRRTWQARQARSVDWWLRAARRDPRATVLFGTCLVTEPLFLAFGHPAWWLRLPAGVIVFGPLNWWLRDLARRRFHTLELADQAAERIGSRRPLDAPDPDTHLATFSWRSPTGYVIAARATFWILAAITLGVIPLTTGSLATTRDLISAIAPALLLMAVPVVLALSMTLGILRNVRATLTRSTTHSRTLVEVVGIEPDTRQWILNRLDGGGRVTVTLLVGSRLLIAGDTLLADGSLQKQPRGWWRITGGRLALTGQYGTVWGSVISNRLEGRVPTTGETIS